MILEYPYNNFYEMVEKNAEKYPKKPAVFTEGLITSHLELKKKIDILSAFLKSESVKKGDRVAIILGNSLEFIVSFLAITKIGAIAVPLNVFLKHEELEFNLKDCKASFLIVSAEFKNETKNLQNSTFVEKILWCGSVELKENQFSYENILQQEYKIEPSQSILNDTACIIYTSGTTGYSKGAVLSYKNIFSNLVSSNLLFDISHKDRFMVYLPMFHTFTLTVMVLLPIFCSASIVSVKSVFPFSNVLKQCLLKRATIFLGVPTVYNALLKTKIPWYFMFFNRIRLFISGSAPLSAIALEKFSKKFKKGKLLEGYGLSECSPCVAINLPHKQKPLSVGLAMPGYEIKVVDEEMLELPRGEVGEIIIKGDCVMQGYYKRIEATDEAIVNGWMRTGDLGKIDEDGFIYIVDRKKDLIISKGINIYPREIEEVFSLHESIDASAVIGIKDEMQDECAIAFIQLKEDAKPISELELKKFLKNHLANFKIPKHIYTVEELPRNATNKVLKRVLKEQVLNGDFLKTKDKD